MDIKEILRLHALWLNKDPKGKKADLSGAMLRKINLCSINLSDANLSSTNLECANLPGANLSDVFYGGAFVKSKLFTGCIKDMPQCGAKRAASCYLRAWRFGLAVVGQTETNILGLTA